MPRRYRSARSRRRNYGRRRLTRPPSTLAHVSGNGRINVLRDVASVLSHPAVRAAGRAAYSSARDWYQTRRPTPSQSGYPPKKKFKLRGKPAPYQKQRKPRHVGFHPHRHNFRSDVMRVIPPRSGVGVAVKGLKRYQRHELRFFPHPLVQKYIHADWKILPNTENVVSESMKFKDLATPVDKDHLGIWFSQISAPAPCSGTHMWSSYQNNPTNTGFERLSANDGMIGRQNLASTLTWEEDQTTHEAILTKSNCVVHLQSIRNYPVLVTVRLMKMKQTGPIALSDDDMRLLFNSAKHTDYDEIKQLITQTKVLGPCSSNKIVSQKFDLTFKGYAKFTKQFYDSSAVTVAEDIEDAGATPTFGQQGRKKLQPNPDDEANRYVWTVLYKRLGNTTVGKAYQSKEWAVGSVNKTVGMEYNMHTEDGELLHDTVTGTTNDGIAVDDYTDQELSKPSAKVKIQITNNWRVRHAKKSPATFSGSGKTKMLEMSREIPTGPYSFLEISQANTTS